MNTSGIYTITSHKTSKVYVGSSVRTAHRWRVHQRDLRKGVHTNLHLQRHVDKYGLEDLVFEVVRVEPNPTRRLGFEELLIAGLFGPACFNQATSAKAPMTGRKHTPETLAKMSATAKGRPFPPGAHAKSLETNRGRVHTPEQRAKAATSRGFLGHTHTPETIAKIAATKKLRLGSRAIKPPTTTV